MSSLGRSGCAQATYLLLFWLMTRCAYSQPAKLRGLGKDETDAVGLAAKMGVMMGSSKGMGMMARAAVQQLDAFPARRGQTSHLLPQSGATEPSNVVCGAVQAVLAHKTDPDICFAGSVNGGVWRTTSCTEDIPEWEPLTDDQDSLSVGDMVFDAEDNSGKTLAVAIGARSSFALKGGPAIGMLYTKNALDKKPSWTNLDNSAGSVNFREKGVQFNSLFVRGALMLASAFESAVSSVDFTGIYRSTDQGQTWANVLSGIGRAIAADANDPQRFYAVLDNTTGAEANGIFTSADGGATWTATAYPDGYDIGPGELNNAKLSVSEDGSRVWVALLKKGVSRFIMYSDNHGDLWTEMDEIVVPYSENNDDGNDLNPRLKPGGQGGIHFSLLANPTNKDEIYVAGDRQATALFPDYIGDEFPPNFLGATNYSAIIFRGNASIERIADMIPDTPSPQWEHMTDSDKVKEIPGGGTASNSGPHADSRDMEFRADGFIIESNDGGVAVRSSPSDNKGDWFGICGSMQVFEILGVAYEPRLKSVIFGNQDVGTIGGFIGDQKTFTTLSVGDGGTVAIDYTSDADFNYYYHAISSGLIRTKLQISNHPDFDKAESDIFSEDSGNTYPFALRPTDQKQLVFAIQDGLNYKVIFSPDRGETSHELIISDHKWVAIEYSEDGQTMYAVHAGGDVYHCSHEVLIPSCSFVGTDEAQGSGFRLVVDPRNSNVLYSVKDIYSPPLVRSSTNGGANWEDITVDGSILQKSDRGGGIAFIHRGEISTVVVGTSSGILIPDGGIGVGWKLLADGLPATIITELVYDPTDDLLVVATMGRGVWLLHDASKAVEDDGDSLPSFKSSTSSTNAG